MLAFLIDNDYHYFGEDETRKGAAMIDQTAFHSLSYGLYIIASRAGAYYPQVKGGKTPPKASSFLPDDLQTASASKGGPEAATPKFAWRCTVCGHIEYVDELPDDFVCPVCGVGKDMFEKIELS